MDIKRRLIISLLAVTAVISGLACSEMPPDPKIQFIGHSPIVPYTMRWDVSGCRGLKLSDYEPSAAVDFNITRVYGSGKQCRITMTIMLPTPETQGDRSYVQIIDGPYGAKAYVARGGNAASIVYTTSQ